MPLTLVEFKRPGRNDYSNNQNPISQIYSYVRQLRDSDFENINGEFVSKLTDDQAVDCILIADISSTLRQYINDADGFPTSDGEGFVIRNRNLNIELRIIPFQQMIDEAELRDQTFFEFLRQDIAKSSVASP